MVAIIVHHVPQTVMPETKIQNITTNVLNDMINDSNNSSESGSER